MKIFNNWFIIILLCLTLGLAPFYPEPHLWGKLKWALGDSTDMQAQDWFDLVLHGLPFLLLIRLIIVKAFRRY